MVSLRLFHLLPLYISAFAVVLRHISSATSHLVRSPIIANFLDACLSLYFFFVGLSPVTVDLDNSTTVHFWTAAHRRFNRQNLVLVHGYGGNSRWQFIWLVGPLSRSFNLYVPDLLFFGKSRTLLPDRSEEFQARCVAEGLRRLGVGRYSVFGISYGGYVSYWMAEKWPEMVERVAIASCGLGWTEEQKKEQLEKFGKNAREILLPKSPEDLRRLLRLSIHKYNPSKWIPDWFLRQFVTAICTRDRNEKLELADHLLSKNAGPHIPILSQETLLIWGDHDEFFPLSSGYQLQRRLGSKTKLEVIKDTGHASNMESPNQLSHLIKSFVLGYSKDEGRMNSY